MKIPAPKPYEITLQQTKYKSPAWIVRVHRKRLLFKRRISSDWFLDPIQAKQFAEQLAADLDDGTSIQQIKSRKPGWVLHQPFH